jgi:8-oxo-dGTP pyrophosphatase MutT (NUDIX family)
MRIILKFIIAIRKIWIYKILKATTYGVRIVLLNKNKILLIKHPNDNYWVLPGGGVKKHETQSNAAMRECLEETGYQIFEPLEKLGMYRNFGDGKKDFVTVYVNKIQFRRKTKIGLLGRLEVEKIKWFKLSKLPKTSAATKRRIAEVHSNDFKKEIRKW